MKNLTSDWSLLDFGNVTGDYYPPPHNVPMTGKPIDWSGVGAQTSEATVPVLPPELPPRPELVRPLLNTALFLLTLVIAIWCITWVRNCSRSPYRYSTILLYHVSLLVSFALYLVRLEGYRIHCVDALSYFTVVSYDISLCVLLGYVVLCLIKVVKNEVTNAQLIACLLLCTIPAILYRGIVIILAFHSNINIDVVAFHWLTWSLPYALVLAAIFGVDVAVIHKSFCGKRGALSLEHKFIRLSSVWVFFIATMIAAKELVADLATFGHYQSLQDQLTIQSILTPVQCIVSAVFLCFLDLEIWASLPWVKMNAEYSKLDDGPDSASKPTKEDGAPVHGGAQAKHGASGVEVDSFEMDVEVPLQQDKLVYGAVTERR